jgi:hypothetical protein
MEVLMELLLAELLAVAIHMALVRLLAWIRDPGSARDEPIVVASAA